MECTSIKFELFWRKISRKDGCKGVSENALSFCFLTYHATSRSMINTSPAAPISKIITTADMKKKNASTAFSNNITFAFPPVLLPHLRPCPVNRRFYAVDCLQLSFQNRLALLLLFCRPLLPDPLQYFLFTLAMSVLSLSHFLRPPIFFSFSRISFSSLSPGVLEKRLLSPG